MPDYTTTFATESGQAALPAAVVWIERLILGPLGTSIAVLAIAFVGFAMLAGRVDWRKGLRVVLGCFILFGAPAIVNELMALLRGTGAEVANPTPPAEFAPPASAPQSDPYAGASVPMDGRAPE